ncbi:MAG: molybdate ABC transporter permease subunit [Myxococcota bacterium]
MTVDPISAIGLSLSVATAATALAFPPAVLVAWALARWRFRGKSALTAVVTAPLVLPPVITGLVLLRLFGRSSPIGAALADAGVPVVFSWFGAVLAAGVVGFPLYVLTIRSAFEAVDRRYEEVSLTLGAPPAATWARITLPLSLPGIAAATVLAFARALGEFGATAVIAGNIEGKTRTIALAVYALLDAPDGEAQARPLVLASFALSFGALALFELLVRRQRVRLDLEDG